MALFESLSMLQNKLFVPEDINTDNFVFKLNRIYTVAVLVAFSFLLSLAQYVGDPIDCIQDKKTISNDIFDTYCWVEGTYTKKNFEFGSKEHYDCNPSKLEDCWHHKYYQWVALVLLVQAGCFYLPRFIWQTWEDGKIKALITGLDRKALIRGLQTTEALKKGETHDKIMDLVYNWREIRGTNNAWAWKFYLCELMNMVNIVGQFKLTDFFLGGQFSTVGIGGFELDVHNSILPITANCFLNTTGTGGGTSIHSGLCVLPLNMVNQKFYTLLFVWLSVLMLLNSLSILCRLLVVGFSEIREFMLRYYYQSKDTKRTIIQRSSHGDWLLLTFLLDNMNILVRGEFLAELGELKHYDEDAR